MNALKPLLGAERADSAKEVERLVSHGQICTFPEKGFKSGPFIGPAVLPDLFVQSTVSGQIKTILKHGFHTTIMQCKGRLTGQPHLGNERSKGRIQQCLPSDRRKTVLTNLNKISFQGQITINRCLSQEMGPLRCVLGPGLTKAELVDTLMVFGIGSWKSFR